MGQWVVWLTFYSDLEKVPPWMQLVNFPQYTGPLVVPGQPTVVPVFPIEVSDRKKRSSCNTSREMFPVRLGFCLTCHKAQGFTCGPGHIYERVVSNMGPVSAENWGSGHDLLVPHGVCARINWHSTVISQVVEKNVLLRGEKWIRCDRKIRDYNDSTTRLCDGLNKKTLRNY